ncbi:S8 family serine peptidase [Bacillus lacus]|uniref:S8 family serine peptidase n=1 Tax=Metabacillus lacus TaxID=1983721 RepID=A0A7X2J1D4_9BACI|nr:S8 family peptidase [Metabacillus lacus]MRX73666.1 S8 family serine peptidase [Metabacillus lacus]
MKSFIKKSAGIALAAALTIGSLPNMTHASYEQSKSSSMKSSMLEKLSLKEGAKLQSFDKKGEKEVFDERKLVIKYKTPLSSAAHNAAGGKLVKRVSGLGYDVIELKGSRKLQDVAKAYANTPGVLSVSRSAKVQKLASPDLKAPDMYHLKTLKAEEAQKLAGKNAVKVAVVDGGVDTKHPELKNRVAASYNILNPLHKGAPDVHGTHVSGIIAAEKNNGVGGYGINPSAKLLAIDVFNNSWFANDYSIAEGILKAVEQKAQVINLSLGSSVPSPIIEEAVQKALEANITIVAAAGNSGSNDKSYPAAYEGVISVGSTNNKNELSSYSTFGSSVDVVAPGENIYSSVISLKGSSYGNLSGTSMASPAVAGVVSLMLAKNPKLTPYQVNYILHRTSKDLGKKGYDTTFGYGLVDPIAALNYNVKSIPAKPDASEAGLLKNAKALSSGKLTAGSLTKLGQIDAYKIDVKKGEFVQTKLTGAANYDYSFQLRFYPKGKTEASSKTVVNDGIENTVEGALFEAKEDGVLVIAVKDANGNYNELKESTYSLTASLSKEKLDDQVSLADPVVVDKLPFVTSQPYYFTDASEQPQPPPLEGGGDAGVPGEAPQAEPQPSPLNKGDSDFFKLNFTEVQKGETVSASLSGVPGINSSLRLHMVEKMEGESFPVVNDIVDQKGYGEGETLTFQPNANTEYFIEVTNKPNMNDWFFFGFGGFELDLNRSFSSHIPYSLDIKSKVLPADEDNYPMMSEEGQIPEGVNQEKLAQLRHDRKSSYGKNDYNPMDEEKERFNRLKQSARSYEIGGASEGYLQYNGDEDWFVFNSKSSDILEFTFTAAKGYKVPAMEIYQYNEENDDLNYVGSNVSYSWTSFETSAAHRIGVKANSTYYIAVTDVEYRSSFDPYRFTSKTLVKNVADKYEPNDNYDKAVKIGTGSVQGNLSSSGDMDFYYFKPAESGLFGFAFEPLAITNPAYNKLPADVRFPVDAVVVTIEDTNGNGKLDPAEEGNFIYTDYTFEGEEERGAIDAKKGRGYFIVAFNYYSYSSLQEYKLTLQQANTVDEDKGSVVKNNVPSKPLNLKKDKNNKYTAKGYMNPSTGKGDTDYYKLVLDKQTKLTLSLSLPIDLDGAVTIYEANGKQIAKVDHYDIGDREYLPLNLKKGTYYIKIEEVQGRASISPYTLELK